MTSAGSTRLSEAQTHENPVAPEAVIDRSRPGANAAERVFGAWWRARMLPSVGLGVLLCLVMWPAWTTTDRLIINGDALYIHYPYFVLWRGSLAAGEFPFWNPYTFGGIPAFATLQAGYGYPPHWLFSFVPAVSAMNWIIGLHVLLAGFGASWCAGRLGAGRAGQFLSGAAYALGSAMLARMLAGHLSFIEANAWLPWATGLAIRIQRPRAATYLALVVACLALAGQPEILLFCAWWLPLWAGLTSATDGWRRVPRALVLVGLGLALGTGLAAYQLLPARELLAISNRQVGMSWDFRTGASLPPWHVLTAVAPQVFGHPHRDYWPGPGYEWHERLLYLGCLTLFAAAGARGRLGLVCWVAAASALALALGRYVPWYAWAEAALPGYGNLRIPSKHLTLAALALALAAGLGVERLSGRRAALSAVAAAGLLFLAGLTFPSWIHHAASMLRDEAGPRPPSTADALGAGALQGAALVLLLAAPAALLPRRWAVRTMVALATVELVLVLQPFRIHPADPRDLLRATELLRGHDRAAVIGSGGAILANFGPVLRVVQPVGYVSLFSSGYAELLTGNPNPGVAFGIEHEDNPVLRLLGYHVIIRRDPSSATIVEPPPPRAWVARCAWPGGASEAREPDFPRGACVTLPEASARDQPTRPGPASILAERAGWLVVEAEGPGWLVTTQPWYPGWSATIDRSPAEVAVLDGALVGVRLPPGKRTVTLEYRPAGIELGLLISLAAGVLLIAGAGSASLLRRSGRWPRAAADQAVGPLPNRPR